MSFREGNILNLFLTQFPKSIGSWNCFREEAPVGICVPTSRSFSNSLWEVLNLTMFWNRRHVLKKEKSSWIVKEEAEHYGKAERLVWRW
jgi:hypothetical protein